MKKSVVLAAAALTLAAVTACKSTSSSSGGGATGTATGTAGSASGTAAATNPWASTGGDNHGAAAPSQPAAPPPVTAKLTRPFFFHATKDGAHDVWLFGTIHIGVDPQAVPDGVLGKLDDAAIFAMETDLADPTVLKAIMRQDGTTLEQELGPEVWKKFVAAVGESTANGFQHLKISAAATILDVQGMPMTTPIDLFLLQRAKKATKTVIYLEAASKQLALLDKWMDVRVLKEMLDDLADTKKKNGELIASYVAGDDAKAIEMGKDDADFVKSGRSHEEFVQFMKELLFDRNASWIPEIEAMAKKGNAFVAVGAMHLLGPGSVTDLLGKAGWKVERVAP